jgi:DNA-binding GntR family transcriptional regulator
MAQVSLKPQERPTLWQDAVSVLRRSILTGELQPGDRVSEPQLAQFLGTSRAPARDAIRQLVQEGLLEQLHGTTVVTGCSETELRQLYENRVDLEAKAIRLIAGKVPPANERELRHAVGRMVTAAEQGDLAAFHSADMAFHRAMVAAAGDRWLLVLWNTLAPTVAAAVAIADELASQRRPLPVHAEGHATLLETVLRGDADEAIKQSTMSARNATRMLLAQFGHQLARKEEQP